MLLQRLLSRVRSESRVCECGHIIEYHIAHSSRCLVGVCPCESYRPASAGRQK